ncbi:enhancer of split m4 protein-like [Arctopsyche grandis]|uniref:enhancer of split m4 protein-like n=1 Tax=Arctopsyche grandis TaxID=121162 RepID=UPI00406D6D27
MSVYATNEYIISSNNSINDNKYNTQKAASKSHKIKSILKPLLKMLKKNNKKKSVQQQQCDFCTECDDNSSNEELEASLFEELDECQPNSAILVCNNDGQWNVTPVHKGQTFVPVHFARTEAGTFFWTSITKGVDSDLLSSRHCYTECQDAAEQMPNFFGQDRWVQA